MELLFLSLFISNLGRLPMIIAIAASDAAGLDSE